MATAGALELGKLSVLVAFQPSRKTRIGCKACGMTKLKVLHDLLYEPTRANHIFLCPQNLFLR